MVSATSSGMEFGSVMAFFYLATFILRIIIKLGLVLIINGKRRRLFGLGRSYWVYIGEVRRCYSIGK